MLGPETNTPVGHSHNAAAVVTSGRQRPQIERLFFSYTVTDKIFFGTPRQYQHAVIVLAFAGISQRRIVELKVEVCRKLHRIDVGQIQRRCLQVLTIEIAELEDASLGGAGAVQEVQSVMRRDGDPRRIGDLRR
jgi:hypothetical protein